jgi:hypothetical protein
MMPSTWGRRAPGGGVRLAEQEPDEDSRRDWAGLSKVFADRVGCLRVWEKALEEWGMWKSKVIEEWRNDARREDLLRLLELRFPGQVTEDLSGRIAAEKDEAKLRRWFDLAATSAMEAIRAEVLK